MPGKENQAGRFPAVGEDGALSSDGRFYIEEIELALRNKGWSDPVRA